MESLSKYTYFEIGCIELLEKVSVFKKYHLVKKFFFWKSSCSEQVPGSKKWMFWIISYFWGKVPPKQ